MKTIRILFIVLLILGLLAILFGVLFTRSFFSLITIIGIVLILIPLAFGLGKHTEETV